MSKYNGIIRILYIIYIDNISHIVHSEIITHTICIYIYIYRERERERFYKMLLRM